MHSLLAALSVELGQGADDQTKRLEAILSALEDARVNPRDLSDPLTYRAAVTAATDLLVSLYGDEALARARIIQAAVPYTFARVVTRRLERMRREAERCARNGGSGDQG